MKKPKFEAKIQKKIEVHLKGDNTYYSADNMAQAEKLKKQLEKEAKEEWEEKNSLETKKQAYFEHLLKNVENFIDSQKKRLWHMVRDSTSTDVIEEVKSTRDILKDIVDLKREMVWHQGHFNNSDTYPVQKLPKDEKEELDYSKYSG